MNNSTAGLWRDLLLVYFIKMEIDAGCYLNEINFRLITYKEPQA